MDGGGGGWGFKKCRKSFTKKSIKVEIDKINILNTKLIETPENCTFLHCSLEICSKDTITIKINNTVNWLKGVIICTKHFA